jgi:hypothetical protein
VGFKVWGEELPQLAKKVRQIEGIHNYVGELGILCIYLKDKVLFLWE